MRPPLPILAVLFIAHHASAQWPGQLTTGTNIRYWVDAATSNKIYVKDAWSAHSWTACTERATALGIAAPTTNRFFRFERNNLVNIKDWVVSNVGSFLDIRYATNGTYDGYFDANPGDWFPPFLTKDTLESIIGAPSDYFDSTPWRALSSTNTANGWHYIDDAMNQLVWTATTNGLDWEYNGAGTTNSWRGNDWLGLDLSTSSRTWADALNQATNTAIAPHANDYLLNTGDQPPRWIWYAQAMTNDADHAAYWASCWNNVRAVNVYTGVPAMVDTYVWWWTREAITDCDPTGIVWNAYGTGVPEGPFLMASSNTYFGATSTNYTGTIGTETNGWPTVIDEPDSDDCLNDFYYERWEGHEAQDPMIVYRFDGTNGLVYISP